MDNSPVQITRTVRFCVEAGVGSHFDSARSNTFAGWPSMRGLGAFYELDITCVGTADPRTGYLVSISTLDNAAREHALPIIAAAFRDSQSSHPAFVLADVVRVLHHNLGSMLSTVCWRLTPYYHLSMHAAATDQVLMRQQFEFSAAHRLHCDDLDAETNRRLFGKCNNPNGHGHNYRLEVAVAVPVDADRRTPPMRLDALEHIVDQTIIKRFDHKHLNLDTAEFASLNPSVEHIAQVCHSLLQAPFKQAGAAIHHATVWETAKTSCTYPATAAP